MLDMELAREILNSDGFFRNHTVDITRLERGDVELSVPLTENVQRLGGIMSGAAIMAFSDAASAFSVMTLDGVQNEVTSNLGTNFYSPVKSGPVLFHGTTRKTGKTLAYCHVEVRDGSGNLCAESFGTYYLFRE